MKSLIKLTFKSVFTLGVIVILAYFCWKYILPKLNEREQRERKEYVITKVFDGDTFEADINGKKEKVRMLGIDTPEKFDSDKLTRDMERTKKDSETIKKLGELSSQFTRKLLEGKKVLVVSPRYLKENNVHVALAVGGDELGHWFSRPFKNGTNSWKHVVSSIFLLHKFDLKFNLSFVLCDKNINSFVNEESKKNIFMYFNMLFGRHKK